MTPIGTRSNSIPAVRSVTSPPLVVTTRPSSASISSGGVSAMMSTTPSSSASLALSAADSRTARSTQALASGERFSVSALRSAMMTFSALRRSVSGRSWP